jgi:predicted DNA-binding transcriptional regulator AlpA
MMTQLKPLPDNPNTLIPAASLSEYLPIARQTAARWRHEGKGPRYLSLGGRRIVYRVADLRQFLDACTRTSTSDMG